MQPIFQTIVEYWHSLGEFFAFDAALLAEPSIVVRLALLGVLLFCSAFFSSSETALFSLSRLDLQQLRRERNPQSEALHALLDQPRRLIISILTGNELINLEKPLEDLTKPALYVSPRQTIDQLLPLLRKRDDHMAVVVDEFGSAIGMITMEDIIEEVVGEIDVGYDFDEYSPKKRHQLEEVEPDIYLMDARIPISEAAEVLGVHLSDRDAHTVGGLVTARLRRIPRIGDIIEEAGFCFAVEEASDRAPLRLRISSH